MGSGTRLRPGAWRGIKRGHGGAGLNTLDGSCGKREKKRRGEIYLKLPNSGRGSIAWEKFHCPGIWGNQFWVKFASVGKWSRGKPHADRSSPFCSAQRDQPPWAAVKSKGESVEDYLCGWGVSLKPVQKGWMPSWMGSHRSGGEKAVP